ncbi:MFS transporter [Jeotgalibacillus salarius]|uniref:MFS transporter n=1 Tax=Jeotgalibacillus salarius TaxID=546023 RepID=A0A4Y8LLV4_9BACL|nr:MFS transporter [Jeotgalibacillus salarius]TFE04022.1 MFS transporter [Jeotgalibacillus salarius]
MSNHRGLSTSWQMLGWLLLAQVAVALVGRSLAPLGPLIAEDFTLTKAQVGLLPSFLFLGQMLVSIPAGILTDKIGTRRLLLIVCLVLGTAFLLGSFASGFYILLFFIMLGGMGYGATHPVTNRGILYWFPAKRGTAMGIKQMGVTFGSALAAIALLPLAVTFGWRIAMAAACIVLMLSGVIAFRFYKEQLAEKTSREPALKGSMLGIVTYKPLLLISVVALILNGSQMSVNTYLLFFVTDELFFSLALAGTMLVLSEASGSLGRIIWGSVSDSIFGGKRFPVLMIIIVTALTGTLGMAFLSDGIPVPLLVALVMILGFAVSGFNGLWMNIATELTPKQQAGAASGVSLTIGSAGVIMLPPLFGLTIDVSGNFQSAWLMLTSLLGVAGMLALVLRKLQVY